MEAEAQAEEAAWEVMHLDHDRTSANSSPQTSPGPGADASPGPGFDASPVPFTVATAATGTSPGAGVGASPAAGVLLKAADATSINNAVSSDRAVIASEDHRLGSYHNNHNASSRNNNSHRSTRPPLTPSSSTRGDGLPSPYTQYHTTGPSPPGASPGPGTSPGVSSGAYSPHPPLFAPSLAFTPVPLSPHYLPYSPHALLNPRHLSGGTSGISGSSNGGTTTMSPSSSTTPSTSSPSTYPINSRGGASNQHTPTSLTAAGAKGVTSRSSSPYTGDTPQGGASHHPHSHHSNNNNNNNSSTTNTSPAYAFGHNRSLHIKLSSPDRKRATSPSEVKSRQEARQLSAEANRDRTIAERKMKAMLVSEKVRKS